MILKQIRNCFRFSLLTILRLIYRIDIRHQDRVPENGGVILVANHVSYIDWLIISAACHRPIRFIFNNRYSKMPLIGWFLNIFSAIPVSPTSAREMIRKASDSAREGDVVCIFPEGQLSRTGMMNEMKKGFHLIASKAEVPVIPIYLDSLWGSIFSFERSRYFWKWPLRLRYPLSVNFGKSIPYEDANPRMIRESLMSLSAESLNAHSELQVPLDTAIIRALKKKPGSTCLIEYSRKKRRLKRGQLLALSIALSSYWKRSLPGESDKIAVFLPPGSTPVYITLALILTGKIPVNLPFHHKPDLDTVSGRLNENGIQTIITSRAFFPQLEALCRSENPQYHLLDMRSEIDAAGIVRIMIERILVYLEPLRTTLRRLDLDKSETLQDDPMQQVACGYFTEADSNKSPINSESNPRLPLPPAVFLSQQNILAQVQQLRSTNLLNSKDAVFCENPLNEPAGIYFSLFLPVFSRCTTVMRSFSQQQEGAAIEAIMRENSVSTLILSPAVCRQILAEDRWHPELREQVRQILTFCPLDPLLSEELSSHTEIPVLEAYAPQELGSVVSLSLANPPLASTVSPDQTGYSTASIGRLLPGIAIRSANNEFDMKSAALPDGWHPMPPGTHMDDEGFVFLSQGKSREDDC